ncbi:MAG: hypothetical protein AABY22_01665 [Nanoarchaeota archaeon]
MKNTTNWITKSLNKLIYVEWDRYFEYKGGLVCFGWIDREKDNYKDFVTLEFNTESKGLVMFTTSSALYSKDIAEILGFDYSECKRIENKFKANRVIRK